LPPQNRQEINSLNKNLILKILYLMYEILDQNNSSSVEKAYDILIKCFLFCDSFDQGMVMYFRYKIYEYIKFNRNNVYSHFDIVEDGNSFNSILKVSDLVYLVYEDFYHSSNILIKETMLQR
jgi:hypothetical protein